MRKLSSISPEKIVSFSTALLFTASLCSCSYGRVIPDQQNAEITFSWWGKDERNENTLKGISAFEESHTDIGINPQYSDFEGFKAKMDSEFYSDTEADVMQLNYSWLYEYSPDGEDFYDLNELSDYIDLSNFSQDELDFGTINGKLNALPISLSSVTFVYNKTLYDNYGLPVPSTWDDLFNAANVMRSDEVYPIQLTKKNFWLCCCAYLEQTTGKKVFDGSFDLTENDIAAMIDFYNHLVDEKVSKIYSEFERSDLENCLTGGTAVWISDSSHYSEGAQKAGFEMVVGDYPVTNNYISYGWSVKPTGFYAIKKDTANPKAAAEFTDYLLNSADMAVIQGSTKGIPVSRSAKEALEARDMLGGIEYSAEQKMQNTEELDIMSPYLENEDVIDIFIDACDSVYYEKSHTKEAAQRAYSSMKEVMEGIIPQ